MRRIQPIPPPSVSPATPVCVTIPDGTASPNACVSLSSSPSSTPACTRAVRFSGSTRTPFIGGRSIINASSATDRPGNECPPLRTATGSPLSRPNFTAAITSDDAGAANDQRRVLVERAVPDLAVDVVLRRARDARRSPRKAASSIWISSATAVIGVQFLTRRRLVPVPSAGGCSPSSPSNSTNPTGGVHPVTAHSARSAFNRPIGG